MSKVFVVIRSIGEKTIDDCVKAVEERFGEDYIVLRNYKPLEAAAKETIKIGIEKELEGYDWIYAVDADVILTQDKKFYESYCEMMLNEFKDRLFSFNAWLNCTKRGMIVGSHFYRTKYCQEVIDKIENISFQYKPGREESELTWWVRDKMSIGTVVGAIKKSFGNHIFNK